MSKSGATDHFPGRQIRSLPSSPECLQCSSMLEETGPEWLSEEVKTGVSKICNVFERLVDVQSVELRMRGMDYINIYCFSFCF